MSKEPFGLMRKVSVSARAYTAAMLAVGTEETRYYLTGVMIEPNSSGGVTLVATNGHVLIAIHDKEGEANGKWICPVPSQMRRFLLANLEPRQEPEGHDGFYLDEDSDEAHDHRQPDRITFDGLTASITAPEFPWKEKSPLEVVMAANAPAIDGTFPNWPKVVPRPAEDSPPLPLVTVACRYMIELGRAVRIYADSFATGMRVRGIEKNGPVLLSPYDNPAMLMVVMPMRDDDATLDVPEWVPAVVQAEA